MLALTDNVYRGISWTSRPGIVPCFTIDIYRIHYVRERETGLVACLSGTSITTATFVAVVDTGTRISFLFARRRYLSIFGTLLLTNKL